MRNVGPYAVALKAGGEVDELLELCASLSHLQVEGKQLGLWDIGMAAAANTGDEQLVLKTLKDAVAAPSLVGMKERVYEIMISFYCERGELEKAREWYNKAVDERNVPPPSTMVTMLKACIRNGRMEYGDEMLNTLKKKIISPDAASETNKEAWDTALAFTVAQGKGVAGLSLTFAEMEKFIEDHPGACPPADTTTLNTILRVAVECHDMNVVRELEEYFKNHQDIDPSLETYQLFLQNALEIPDLPRAVSFFENIRFNVARFPKQYEAEQEQQLLIALASQSPPSLQHIQEIYTDLMQWRVKLFPPTVLKLLEIHLQYNDMDGIRSFVLSHVGYLTAADRQKVIEILMAHCFADSTSIQTCWETYLIMANHLPELSVEQRHAFIDFFFEHDNPHVATKVLTHMTLAREPDRMPNRDTYVKAFLHLAIAQDQTSLQTTHKRLSMDARVNADTELYNYLLLAAARSSLYTKAWIIYEDIARSKEGPDSATFDIVWGELCKRDRADGFRTALAIWNRCRRNRVQLTDRNLASFVEALAWHHRWGEAFERIKQAEEDLDEDGKSWITVGPRTIGTLFSTAVPNTHPPSPTFPKPDFSDSEIMPPLPLDNILYNWYNAKHPELWAQLQQAMRKPAPDHRRLTVDDINPYKDVPEEEVMERFFSGGFIREHWRYEASVEMLLEDFRSMRVVKLMNI
ncbi:hypothetical protein EX30DRAFT_352570 [Ascodesmis nigricans]|uniref:TPR-like protein n=1 Tax=Ascodesmis nigricans TaxID=341454 RepID=A0A4S2MIG4_9PEZI|nr:hypothetical protein EX30DRAFT_352570 [Ascodesmis nigricans]